MMCFMDCDELSREIVKSDRYMNWLENFTEEFNNFSDDSWVDCKEEISIEDHQMVSFLDVLFDAVDSYARMNYLKAKKSESGRSYSVSYNGNVYEIGRSNERENTYFVSRSIKEDDTISFEDIKRGEKSERAKKIDSIFGKLDGVIDELSNEDVSDYLISDHIGKVLLKK